MMQGDASRATECGCPDPRWRCYRAGLRALPAARRPQRDDPRTGARPRRRVRTATAARSRQVMRCRWRCPVRSRQALRWLFKRDAPFRVAPRLDFTLLEWLLQFAHRCTWDDFKRTTAVRGTAAASSRGRQSEELVRSERFGLRVRDDRHAERVSRRRGVRQVALAAQDAGRNAACRQSARWRTLPRTGAGAERQHHQEAI